MIWFTDHAVKRYIERLRQARQARQHRHRHPDPRPGARPAPTVDEELAAA